MAHIALAGCIIKNEQGKILLIHRNTANGHSGKFLVAKLKQVKNLLKQRFVK